MLALGPIGAHRKQLGTFATVPHSRQGGFVKGLNQGSGMCGSAERNLGRPGVLLVRLEPMYSLLAQSTEPGGGTTLYHESTWLSQDCVCVFKRCWVLSNTRVGFHFCRKVKVGSKGFVVALRSGGWVFLEARSWPEFYLSGPLHQYGCRSQHWSATHNHIYEDYDQNAAFQSL